VLGDWLVRREHVTIASLLGYCSRSTARHAEAARRAAGYVRERVDSPMESRLRLLLVLAGLPEPEVNLRFVLEQGTAKVRLDLSYPSVKVAVEYDGRHHAEVVEQWEGDLDRREDLDSGEWRIVVVTSRGIYREPERTITRVWRVLRKRGLKPLGPPTDGWRVHFGH
jgi:very-short-patch-repair endonuclease